MAVKRNKCPKGKKWSKVSNKCVLKGTYWEERVHAGEYDDSASARELRKYKKHTFEGKGKVDK